MSEAPEYPYPPSNGRTHYPGCWQDRGHHNCAVAEVARLREAMREAMEDPHARYAILERALDADDE